jgi:hypothetical protein
LEDGTVQQTLCDTSGCPRSSWDAPIEVK